MSVSLQFTDPLGPQTESQQIESPCVRQCCLDGDDICVGCKRSMDEIMQWSSASDELKRQILLNCEQRKSAVTS